MRDVDLFIYDNKIPQLTKTQKTRGYNWVYPDTDYSFLNFGVKYFSLILSKTEYPKESIENYVISVLGDNNFPACDFLIAQEKNGKIDYTLTFFEFDSPELTEINTNTQNITR